MLNFTGTLLKSFSHSYLLWLSWVNLPKSLTPPPIPGTLNRRCSLFTLWHTLYPRSRFHRGELRQFHVNQKGKRVEKDPDWSLGRYTRSIVVREHSSDSAAAGAGAEGEEGADGTEAGDGKTVSTDGVQGRKQSAGDPNGKVARGERDGDGIPPVPKEVASKSPIVKLIDFFEGGQPCDETQQARSSEVHIQCCEGDFAISNYISVEAYLRSLQIGQPLPPVTLNSVSEPGTCRYQAVVCTPLLCSSYSESPLHEELDADAIRALAPIAVASTTAAAAGSNRPTTKSRGGKASNSAAKSGGRAAGAGSSNSKQTGLGKRGAGSSAADKALTAGGKGEDGEWSADLYPPPDAVNADQTRFVPLLRSINNSCVHKQEEGWWTYEVCFGRGIRQMHYSLEQVVVSDGKMMQKQIMTSEYSLGNAQQHVYRNETALKARVSRWVLLF